MVAQVGVPKVHHQHDATASAPIPRLVQKPIRKRNTAGSFPLPHDLLHLEAATGRDLQPKVATHAQVRRTPVRGYVGPRIQLGKVD
jgi:hypothetical protein